MWQQIRLLIGPRKKEKWRSKRFPLRLECDGWIEGGKQVESNSAHSFRCLRQSLLHTRLRLSVRLICFLRYASIVKRHRSPSRSSPPIVCHWFVPDVTVGAPRGFSHVPPSSTTWTNVTTAGSNRSFSSATLWQGCKIPPSKTQITTLKVSCKVKFCSVFVKVTT